MGETINNEEVNVNMESDTVNENIEEAAEGEAKQQAPLYIRIMTLMTVAMALIITALLLKNALEPGDHRPSSVLENEDTTIKGYDYSEIFGNN